MRLYNTLSRHEETFVPGDGRTVRLYACGLTVYARGHVGNFRTFVAVDVLRRVLKHWEGYDVRHVMNFTDVDDRTIAESQKAGVPLREYTGRFIEAFREDAAALGLEPVEESPRATDEANLQAMADMVLALEARGHTYRSEGSVYFRIATLADYGKLVRLDHEGIKPGARIDADKYDKENARDFVLWKATKAGEPTWDYGCGPGRPGWHIECSAMARRLLGDTIDIHAGGVDLIFPHHENEIAQSESYTGKEFSRYWIHNGMLQLGGEKMSKSLGNIISIKEFLSKRSSDVMRMLVLNGTYRAPLMFNDDTLDAAEKNVERLKSALKPASPSASGLATDAFSVLDATRVTAQTNFTEAMDSDFNTAGAVAALFELVKAINTARDNGATDAQLAPVQKVFRELTGVLGLTLEDKKGSGEQDAQVEALIAERTEARKQKNWARSDELRDQLKAMGVVIEDTKDGTTWKWG